MSKKNIIVFMTDQQNADTIKATHMAKTPNIDRFLKESTQFSSCFCPSPHCCPSRASFFTGLYPSEHGVWNNVEVDNTLSRTVYDDVVLFPEQLQEAGYHTVFSGKWHVSAYDGPLERGFDTVLHEYVSNYGRMKPTNKPLTNDWDKVYTKGVRIDTRADLEKENKEFGRIIRPGYPTYSQFGLDENPFGDTDTTQLACSYIEDYDFEKPLFMYVGTTGPHDPYCVPQRFLDLYNIEDIELPESFYDTMEDKPALYRRTKSMFRLTEAEHKESIRRYLAFISYEDYLFGKVLDSIEKKGITEDTVVMYLTDHGDYLANHGLWAKGLPCFREAYNIPAIVRGSGFGEGIVHEGLLSLTDFAPTILDIAGLESKGSGKSFLSILQGDLEELHTNMFSQTNGNEVYGIQRSVWNKKWKFTYNTFDFDELYDLEHDPMELHNLLPDESYNDIVYEMCKKLWQFAKEKKDNATCAYIMVALAPYGPGITIE
ncbi:MAG: sulfatase-like hydrolase/transferase [Lachnospiraceae bacterium]